MSSLVKLICKHCNKTFSRKQSYMNRQKKESKNIGSFCSRKCLSKNNGFRASQNKRVYLNCDACGSKFSRPISYLKIYQARYCSIECRNKNVAKCKRTITPSESLYRKLAFEQYPNKCCLCESKNNLIVHHRNFDHKNNDINNLQIVCRKCHYKLHN